MPVDVTCNQCRSEFGRNQLGAPKPGGNCPVCKSGESIEERPRATRCLWCPCRCSPGVGCTDCPTTITEAELVVDVAPL